MNRVYPVLNGGSLEIPTTVPLSLGAWNITININVSNFPASQQNCSSNNTKQILEYILDMLQQIEEKICV